jgi:tetratricopeptide (TPR) repeat protein
VVALSNITAVTGIDTETLLGIVYWTCDYLLAAEQPEAARDLAGRAVAIAGQFLSPGDVTAFNLRFQLGQAHLRDLPRKAIEILRPLAADTKRVLGPDDVLTLTVRSVLGDAYRYAGQKAQAIKTLEPLAADTHRVLGPEHVVTGNVLNNLAMAYLDAGRTAEAIQLMEQITARREQAYGPDDFHVFYLRYNLAGAYLTAGRIAEGLDILERLAPAAERVLGPQHQLTNAIRDLAHYHRPFAQ